MNNNNSVEKIDLKGIASAFVDARQTSRCLTTYPGTFPSSLEEAYDIQDEAIRRWSGDSVAGWKVGRITGPAEESLGVSRLVGPIFKRAIYQRASKPLNMRVFNGGFAAVEGEAIIIIGKSAPPEKLSWTTDEAIDVIASMNAGAEIASSPFAGINDYGPLVTISDFGNNNGLIIGDAFENWRDLNLDRWICRTYIDDQLVGENSPAAMPGGPIESLRCLLENTARRGIPLQKGMAICAGAITGVHEINIGQSARIEFDGLPPIFCNIEAAQASTAKPSAAE